MDLRSTHVLPWVLRALWTLQVLAAGPAFAAALDPRDRAVQVVGSALLWGLWLVGLGATAVLAPLTLTALRLVAPAAPAAAVWAASTGEPSATAAALAVVSTALAAGLALAAPVGRAFVNGPAYGDERRHLLRLTAPLHVVVPVAWAVVGASVVGAPLLLAARAFVAGGVLAVVGIPASVVAARSLHGLTQRWAVFVPAGLVLKDALTLLDPVLFQRGIVEVLRPAPADSDSLDLTGGAPGLALEVLLEEKVEMTLLKPGERLGESGRSARLLFTPTRPGQVLADARSRRIPTT